MGMFRHSGTYVLTAYPRSEWLASERVSDARIEEITLWLETFRRSQWYGEAATYVEELLCDRLALLEDIEALR